MVTLIGAGPGELGLMTLKGAERLKEADVVLYDRLVGFDILSIIPSKAEKINVGKNAGSHPVPQYKINQILLEKAMQGLNVVRLKGGDPFVFGRGGEELELLYENGIEFEVVPGISSCIAAGAYGGIPVTHRDMASSFHVITGHGKENKELAIDYEALVKTGGTLVFMMSVSNASHICNGLMSAGMSPSMPAAVIENAASFSQRKFLGDVSSLCNIINENRITSPAVIIVGYVCGMSNKLDWFSQKPLFGKRVMITGAKAGGSKLAAQLRELGCDVLEAPCIRIVSKIDDNPALNRAVENIGDYSWMTFTSSTGVSLFFEFLQKSGFDIRKLHHLKIAAVGAETKKEIERHGIFVDYIPEKHNSKELANGLLKLIEKSQRVLTIRAEKGSEEIFDIFNENNIIYDNVVIYNTAYDRYENTRAIKMMMDGKIDYVTFTSSSSVEGFVKAFPSVDFKSIKSVSIGDITADMAKKYGISTTVSKEASISSMVEKLKEALINNGH